MEKYLSEAFLEAVGNDFSEESLRRGLETCTEIWKERGECPAEEMCDLWDVLRDFADQEALWEYEITGQAHGIYKKSRA